MNCTRFSEYPVFDIIQKTPPLWRYSANVAIQEVCTEAQHFRLLSDDKYDSRHEQNTNLTKSTQEPHF
jgi:hypothetical protein